ncbi:Fur family transcriptional regulator [uncultured Clostridium sp.]|uniref:Fur family transcriptional regulator n=1 Tax=uncultured Clostridium sp. TaxID=59620 RepID=UPI0028E99EFA|nr:Fur family transcriptional regulator [uncultured Clostridium sp.]
MKNISSKEVKYIKNKFTEEGYKLTKQREIILNNIIKNKFKHLSVKDVYAAVKVAMPRIGISTVYRTMILLKELNFLCEIDFGDGCTKYEIVSLNSKGYHPHLICSSCKRIVEIESDFLDTLEYAIEQENKFKIKTYNIIFYGLCNECNVFKK